MKNIDVSNLEVFQDKQVCSSYKAEHQLQAAEEVILQLLKLKLKPACKILDVGVGTGRTTPHLMKLTENYIGIDYSAQMIKYAQVNYPNVDFRLGDVRHLVEFHEEEFDLVFFSFNGLDYIDHADRLLAIHEIKRVLKPGGHFAFSSHNRNYEYFDKFKMRYSGEPIPFSKQLLRSAFNRIKNFSRQIYENEYAIITDPGHYYSLLTYYISVDQQKKQLVRAGYLDDIRIFDMNGNQTDSALSPWLYYLASKP
ncbi:MAG TPA: class I SAM-dependent methyltransferase [Ohtaekwangia sp.]|nr:class I SAM-dependent methyltransferase [Ohtaekwangia sp.]